MRQGKPATERARDWGYCRADGTAPAYRRWGAVRGAEHGAGCYDTPRQLIARLAALAAGEEDVPYLTPTDALIYRRAIADAIRRSGPATLDEVASAIGVDRIEMLILLRHEWFELEEDGWHLTAAGWASLEDRGPPPPPITGRFVRS